VGGAWGGLAIANRVIKELIFEIFLRKTIPQSGYRGEVFGAIYSPGQYIYSASGLHKPECYKKK